MESSLVRSTEYWDKVTRAGMVHSPLVCILPQPWTASAQSGVERVCASSSRDLSGPCSAGWLAGLDSTGQIGRPDQTRPEWQGLSVCLAQVTGFLRFDLVDGGLETRDIWTGGRGVGGGSMYIQYKLRRGEEGLTRDWTVSGRVPPHTLPTLATFNTHTVASPHDHSPAARQPAHSKKALSPPPPLPYKSPTQILPYNLPPASSSQHTTRLLVSTSPLPCIAANPRSLAS